MRRWRAAGLLAWAAASAAVPAQVLKPGDHIVAVVNDESVTAGEVAMRVARLQQQARRGGGAAPPEAELRQQVLDQLIEERVITTYARTSGARVEEPELDRAVQSTAAQNQLTTAQLRDRLKAEGMDMARFRNNVRDMMMVERVREREVVQRIRVTDADIDQYLAARAAARGAEPELNIAQILITVPEGASPEVVAQRQARALQAAQRVRAGESFTEVARQMSEDGNRERGGVIGLRPASRLPDLFVEAVRGFQAGQVTQNLVRSGAGFHLIMLVERQEVDPNRVTQTRARHILLRVSPQLTAEVAAKRLAEFKGEVERGRRRFEDLARQHSEDGSAPQGGDLGWANPGQFVPEFEEAMNALPPGGISAPVISRFGVHLIQVIERRDAQMEPKQVREQARAALREQKFEQAYTEWVRDLRARAYIELRDAPQ